MTDHDHLIRVHLNAAVALLESLLASERRADPVEFAQIERALAAGCMLAMHTRLAPSTGLCMLDVELQEPTGAVHPLMSIEMQRPQQGGMQ